MLGVVLWSDAKGSKAVIWCEDHGDLAFCDDTSDDRGDILDTGDLIQFDVTVKSHLRLAQNLKRVSSGAYEGLVETLRSMPVDGPVPVPASCKPLHDNKVFPLCSAREKAKSANRAVVGIAAD